jgi:hypothetical protein
MTLTVATRNWNAPRRGIDPAKTPQFKCMHCEDPAWRPGGVTTLAKHLTQHGIDALAPSYQRVDSEAFQLDLDDNRITQRDGNRWVSIPADDTVDGWIRSRRYLGIVREARDA